MAQIDDFGQKIGGARKDLWKVRGINAGDFADMNDMERNTYVKKDNIWIKPNWEKLVAEGTPQAVAYWQNKMRQSIPPKPARTSEEALKNYINAVSQLRDAVMAVRSKYDIQGFYKNVFSQLFLSSSGYYTYVRPEAEDVISNKVFRAAQASYSKMEREAKKKLFAIPKEDRAYVAAKDGLEIFCYDKQNITLAKDTYDSSANCLTIQHGYGRSFYYLRERDQFYDISKWKENTYFVLGRNGKPLNINFPTREDAEKFVESFARAAQITADLENSKEKDTGDSNRKKNFVPPQLAHVQYTGPNYRSIRPANGQMFLDDLRFRAGEFGNWMNLTDRQTSMNMAYDALRNLADILKVPPEDISLNGSLAIAFGARGRGGTGAAAAHYEPLRQVINLTKMSGAGCLAHEWGHALDHAIGIAAGAPGFATEAKRPATTKLPDCFTHLISTLKYKETEIPAEVRQQEMDPKIKNARRNLKNWIDSAKPLKLPDDLSKAWDDTANRILENPQTFHGTEYNNLFGCGDGIITHPDVEQLSQISKFATKHVIPRSTKEQFALWAKEINHLNKTREEMTSTKSLIKTDFFKGSEEFDKIYSKYGHGYWSSSCEMFARAFDCYITDKLKEAGYHSDYLTSHADSFTLNKDGQVIAAVPMGEERQVINECFDKLLQELKERQLLHEVPVIEVAPEKEAPVSKDCQEPQGPPKKVRYEQMSLDDLLFAASAKTSQGTTHKHGNLPDRSR